jgi:hypothetical protein
MQSIVAWMQTSEETCMMAGEAPTVAGSSVECGPPMFGWQCLLLLSDLSSSAAATET